MGFSYRIFLGLCVKAETGKVFTFFFEFGGLANVSFCFTLSEESGDGLLEFLPVVLRADLGCCCAVGTGIPPERSPGIGGGCDGGGIE